MKPVFLSLFAILFFACSKPVTMGKTPIAIVPDATFLIGYTGGWGGGAAYKLEDGKLYQSVQARGIGDADAIVATAFKPLKSTTGLSAMNELATNYAPALFAQIPPKFNCPEMAHDGVCPYFIVIENGVAKAWTRSDVDKEPTFVTFMNKVEEALTKM
jgi:hypothetical protein